MRYLAIDMGGRRTGLAAGDDRTHTVSPAGVIEHPPGDQLLRAILKAVAEYQPGAIVIGLPLNMDGSEGDAARQIRVFGESVAHATNLPVHYQDERLTSFAADTRMARTGRTHKQKKQIRDAIAAVEILRDFLEATSQER
jgi:putative holliday junction resolvase